jgi:hypothetical protein
LFRPVAAPNSYFLAWAEPFEIWRKDTQRVRSIFLWHYNEGVLAEPSSGVADERKLARITREGADRNRRTEGYANLAADPPTRNRKEGGHS